MSEDFLHGVTTIELTDGVRPVRINKSGVVGIVGTAPAADNADWPLNEPILINAQPRKAATLGATGTLYPAVQQVMREGGASIVVVRVAEGLTPEATMTNIIGSSSAKTGVHALRYARGHVGAPPRTLIAPGFTSQRPDNARNPVVAELLPIAQALRARIYADTLQTYEGAIAWRDDWGSDRVVPFYPNVLSWNEQTSSYVARPHSASAAGLTARVHRDFGFWYSPSNHEYFGVGGSAVPVGFAQGDVDSEANLLNENRISTLVNMGGNYGGWRRWGNGTTASDPLWQFEAVRTSLDMCYEALEEAQLWAVDKPPSLQLLRDMQAMAQAFFDYGKRVGFLVGGRVWLDPERNTPQQTSQGIWSWDIDPEAPAPMQTIRNYAHRNTDYYDDLVADLVQNIRIF
jgi:phage tail sheath protein FI